MIFCSQMRKLKHGVVINPLNQRAYSRGTIAFGLTHYLILTSQRNKTTYVIFIICEICICDYVKVDFVGK